MDKFDSIRSSLPNFDANRSMLPPRNRNKHILRKSGILDAFESCIDQIMN
jgi:hypothetical protein